MSSSGQEDQPKLGSKANTIVIPASFTVLTRDFFANAESVEVVRFETGSQIQRLETGTFDLCLFR
jgi:hypothetical protein